MIFDVTYPVYQGMPVYPGDPGVEFNPVMTLDTDGVRVNSIAMGTHTGTHVDAPGHFIREGKTVEALDLRTLVGRVQVYDLPGITGISASHLDNIRPGRVILKTGHLLSDNSPVKPCLTPGAALFLVRRGITLLGVDFPSVDCPGGKESHHILLESGVVVVENLMLMDVPPGSYQIICLPLALAGLDGAPARVLLKTLPGRGKNRLKHNRRLTT